MKTIKIELPVEIERQLKLINEDEQTFIVEAIKEKINKREFLNKKLEEGYKATFQEDIALTKDFESIDLEEWQ
ncbi:hypothetical protein [Aquiflexum lacus]|uniref:hypothetical protein n=1 Tax=Aquiflexum lacus TaxID=2483805 RepID=UPI0018947883|nr:hypothetical protein [Aquiflexum lacus]